MNNLLSFYSLARSLLYPHRILGRYFDFMKSNQIYRTRKELNEKYRLIAQNTSDLIVFTTFDVNPTYTFVSPSHKKIMGYTEDDLLGKSGLDFIHEDDLEPLMSLLMPYLEAKLKFM